MRRACYSSQGYVILRRCLPGLSPVSSYGGDIVLGLQQTDPPIIRRTINGWNTNLAFAKCQVCQLVVIVINVYPNLTCVTCHQLSRYPNLTCVTCHHLSRYPNLTYHS